MKRTSRIGCFETNSSSTHSLCIVSAEQWEEFKNNENLFWNDSYGSDKQFLTKEEVIEYLKEESNEEFDPEDIGSLAADYSVYNYENLGGDSYESFSQEYVTPNGDKIVAFGVYGYN